MNLLPKSSLKTRFTFLTLAIFLAGISAISFYISATLHKDLEHQVSDQQFSTVSMVADQVDQELDKLLNALKITAAKINSPMMGNRPALQSYLEQRQHLDSMFNGGFFVTGIDGTAIASLPISVGRVGINYMEKDHIAAALREGKSTASKPGVGKMLHTPLIALAVPIHDLQGTVVGALAGVIDLNKPNFLNHITQSKYGKTGGYLLVDRRVRQIISASDNKRVMEMLPTPGISPVIDRFIQGHEGSAVFVNPVSSVRPLSNQAA